MTVECISISGPEIESKEWGQVDFLLSVTSQLTSNFFFLLGYYCDALALTEPTGLCTAGFYCLTGSTTDSPNECPIGKYCPEGRWFCNYKTRMLRGLSRRRDIEHGVAVKVKNYRCKTFSCMFRYSYTD